MDTRNGKTHGAPEAIVGGDREVVERAKRRTFSPRYKLQVLQHTDGLAPGEIGAYLRREGLYWSILSTWRQQREEGTLAGLQPRKRGRKELSADERLNRRVAQLEKEKAAVEEQLRQARVILEVQKKVLSLCEQLDQQDNSSSRS
jgi:transposase